MPLKTGNDLVFRDLLSPSSVIPCQSGMKNSTAVDARLEAGVSLMAELRLHMMGAVHISRLNAAVTAPLKVIIRLFLMIIYIF